MLHASETGSATTEVVSSFMRVVPSPRCTKASRNPVQEWTSNTRSGRLIFGGIFSTPLRSQASDFGSPSTPSFSTFSFTRPLGRTSSDTFASLPADSRRFAICLQPASRAPTSSAKCSVTGRSRLSPASTSSHTASSRSRARGSDHRCEGEANTLRLFMRMREGGMGGADAAGDRGALSRLRVGVASALVPRQRGGDVRRGTSAGERSGRARCQPGGVSPPAGGVAGDVDADFHHQLGLHQREVQLSPPRKGPACHCPVRQGAGGGPGTRDPTRWCRACWLSPQSDPGHFSSSRSPLTSSALEV